MVREYKVMLNNGLMPYLKEIKTYDADMSRYCYDYITFILECITDIQDCAEEYFYVVAFGDVEDDIKIMQCAHGSHESVEVILRPLCTFLLLANCRGCVVFHNHPNDVLLPSENDKKLTDYLKSSLEMLDIELDEHIIVGKSGFYQILEDTFTHRKIYDPCWPYDDEKKA